VECDFTLFNYYGLTLCAYHAIFPISHDMMPISTPIGCTRTIKHESIFSFHYTILPVLFGGPTIKYVTLNNSCCCAFFNKSIKTKKESYLPLIYNGSLTHTQMYLKNLGVYLPFRTYIIPLSSFLVLTYPTILHISPYPRRVQRL
jgi:hypothetical protein